MGLDVGPCGLAGGCGGGAARDGNAVDAEDGFRPGGVGGQLLGRLGVGAEPRQRLVGHGALGRGSWLPTRSITEAAANEQRRAVPPWVDRPARDPVTPGLTPRGSPGKTSLLL